MTNIKRQRFPKHSLKAIEEKNGIKYEKTIFSHGLRVISEEVPSVESFALGIIINSGSVNDPQGLQGLSHFVEHCAFRHTGKRNFKQIASKFESMGAYFNAYTTKENICFYVRALKKHLNPVVDLLTDITFNPVFLAKDTAKEKNVILEEIKTYEDDLEDLIFEYGDNILFKGTALSNPIIGTINSVNAIDENHIQDFHQNHFYPENIILSSAGNISHRNLIRSIESASIVEKLKENKKVLRNQNHKQKIYTPKSQTIKKSTLQSHLLLGVPVEGIKSNDRFPLAVLNVLFGDGMSSRLNQKLREKHGLVYSIYTTLQLYSNFGAFYIYTASDSKNTSKVEKLIFDEIKKITEKNISKTEIIRAKEQLKTGLIMDLESMTGRMESLARDEFLKGKHESIDELIIKIESINQDSLINVARKYLFYDNWSKVLFHP